MNIEFEGNRAVFFKDLKIGDVFRPANLSYSREIFMKTEELPIADGAIGKVGFPMVNAIYLYNGTGIGTALYFEEDVVVEKFESAKLVLG